MIQCQKNIVLSKEEKDRILEEKQLCGELAL
jgi:hypothetical protein